MPAAARVLRCLCGCGETPYVKLLTQLYGDRMMMSNATGCTSIWPSCSFYVLYEKRRGKGPAWSNSLFEDSAEFGFGLYIGVKQIRSRLADLMKEALTLDISQELKSACQRWLDGMYNGDASKAATKKLLPLLEGQEHPVLKEILEKKRLSYQEIQLGVWRRRLGL